MLGAVTSYLGRVLGTWRRELGGVGQDGVLGEENEQ